MRMVAIGLVLACTLICDATAQSKKAKIYVWTDEAGNTVFSDSPKPGAQEKIIPENKNVLPSVNTKQLDITPQKLPDDFTIDITQPADSETVRDNTGSVHVIGRIKPIFKQGYKIQLLLDGKLTEKPQSRSMFVLRNVDRGEHQIQLQLLNQKGKVIASSESVTFYMHRASINTAK
ncbi:DUF4124 domain-containing protein [Thalassotalea eurytherma]|uniref:DUF4124 domain-containing protein n=1 Tax=Thalassotalea eurytherma TaxID=1144278 RepID=A0ABQ6HAI4_9GAMM|nr:DUF4124 domain-containing protein [Thalassotalea eurytherma]GLX83466.1 hypothetical protein theurythT_29190 [Thalassotalea eurytherma]